MEHNRNQVNDHAKEENLDFSMGEQVQEKQAAENEEIKDTGTLRLGKEQGKHNIQLMTIIGEIEGHEAVSGNTKATKYEHLIPRLAEAEDNDEVEGILILLNTLGGDVEAGLAIAEMIATLSKPTVSLVLGGSHSIGGPLAVSADYSFIVPSGTMIVHPVRSTGMFIGVIQSYRNMERTQDRITRFIAEHSNITQEKLEKLMLDSSQLVKDVGTLLEGEDAVNAGIIDEVGGISQALRKLHEMIDQRKEQ
jgi:ATP-dependent protease ClpP protease subunit